MKKRVAVCMSGQSRTWKYCFSNIKNFLQHDDYEFDFFIHTWDVNDNPPIYGRLCKNIQEKYIFESNPHEYVKKYNPILSKIQNYNNFSKRFNLTVTDNTLSMMYSFKQSVILKRIYEKRYKFKYDYVLKLRPDVFFINQSFEEHISKLTNTNKAFLTHFSYATDWTGNLEDDWNPDLYWFFTNSNDANLFSTFYNKKLLYEKQNKSKYTFYKHTFFNNFNPINLAELNSKRDPIYIFRPYFIPFIDNLNVRFDSLIDKKLYYLEATFHNRTDRYFENEPKFLDIVIENNKLEEFYNTDIVLFFENNKFIKNIILNNLEKYLYKEL